MTSHPHIRLAEPPPNDDAWQLELPQDPAAAANYLRGIERAREAELEAIRRLRARIEGGGRSVGRRLALALVAVLALLGAGASGWLLAGREDAAPAGVADPHAGHVAMGSGVSVAIEDSGPSASRTRLAAGETTFVVRNELAAATTVELQRLGANEDAAAPTSHSIEPGERMEWAVDLAPGRYQLCVLRNGRHVMGDTLTVA